MGNGKQGIAERAAQTQFLVARMRQCRPGDVIGYHELSEVAGCNVQTSGRNYLQSARRVVLREYGMVTDTVRTVGIKRLENDAIHAVADAAMTHIRRTTSRTTRKLEAADIAALPDVTRSIHLTRMAQLGVVAVATTDKYARRVTQALGQSMQPPPLAEAIAALKE